MYFDEDISPKSYEKLLSIFDVMYTTAFDSSNRKIKEKKIPDEILDSIQFNLAHFFAQFFMAEDILKNIAIVDGNEITALEHEELSDLSVELSKRINDLTRSQFFTFTQLYISGQTTDIFGTLDSATHEMFS